MAQCCCPPCHSRRPQGSAPGINCTCGYSSCGAMLQSSAHWGTPLQHVSCAGHLLGACTLYPLHSNCRDIKFYPINEANVDLLSGPPPPPPPFLPSPPPPSHPVFLHKLGPIAFLTTEDSLQDMASTGKCTVGNAGTGHRVLLPHRTVTDKLSSSSRKRAARGSCARALQVPCARGTKTNSLRSLNSLQISGRP